MESDGASSESGSSVHSESEVITGKLAAKVGEDRWFGFGVFLDSVCLFGLGGWFGRDDLFWMGCLILCLWFVWVVAVLDGVFSMFCGS